MGGGLERSAGFCVGDDDDAAAFAKRCKRLEPASCWGPGEGALGGLDGTIVDATAISAGGETRWPTGGRFSLKGRAIGERTVFQRLS